MIGAGRLLHCDTFLASRDYLHYFRTEYVNYDFRFRNKTVSCGIVILFYCNSYNSSNSRFFLAHPVSTNDV